MNAVIGHTPGPWSLMASYPGVTTPRGDVAIVTEDGEILSSLQGRPGFLERRWADARLIAAAPDQHAELLACKQFLEDMHTQSVEWTVAESQVRYQAVCAVLAKATGASA